MDFNVFKLPTGTEITYGKNLYILGTSNNGPLLEPTLIKDIQQAYDVFGHEGNLAKSWYEAYQVNNEISIYLVRVSGEHAELTLMSKDPTLGKTDKTISLKSVNAGSMYNHIEIYVHENSLEIVNPEELGGESFLLPYEEYPTTGMLVSRINDLARKGKIYTWAETKNYHIKSLFLKEYYKAVNRINTPISYKYGSDGLNISKNELHKQLELAYNILEGQPIDILCVADAYFDDVSPAAYFGENEGYAEAYYTADRDYLSLPHAVNSERTATFHGQLIDFCYRQLNSSIVTHGVMAFNPLENVEDIFEDNAYINKVVFASCFQDRFDLITKNGEEVQDHGKFISVIMGEFEYKNQYGIKYYNNGYIGYGAMLASKLTPDSTTNTIVPNIDNIRYHLNDTEIVELSKLGVVTFRKSVMKQSLVVCNGVTAQMNGSPYHTVSNMRMIQMTSSFFKILLDDFIGQNIKQLRISGTINKAIDQLIIDLKDKKIVKDIKYNFNLSTVGVAVLKLDILTNYSVEYVSANGQTKL